MVKYPIIKPFGDSAILLDWPQKVDSQINEEVIKVALRLEDAKIPGLIELVVAYQSITVLFDSLQFSFQEMMHALENAISGNILQPALEVQEIIQVPVCYDLSLAMDADSIMDKTQLNWEEIIGLHSSREYRVYMTGFTPGFAYLGGLSSHLESTRKSTPRLSIPAGSVAIAGLQTGIYSMSSPGGWNVIGRTPLKLMNLESENPFIIRTGRSIKFKPISLEEFENW